MKSHFYLIALFACLIASCSKESLEPVDPTDPVNTTDPDDQNNNDQGATIDWQRSFGGSDSDALYDLIVTQDGGYLFSGVSVSNASGDKTQDSRGSGDIWCIRTNASGDVLWDKTLGGELGESSRTVIQTQDGGFILGGYSNSGISGDKLDPNLGGSDFWVIRLDSGGEELWQRTLGGSNNDRITSILEAPDGGIILAGSSDSPASANKSENTIGDSGLFDYWVVKLDANGNEVWENTIGGADEDFLEAMVGTSDGGFLLAGSSFSQPDFDKTAPNIGNSDFWVVKINANGDVVWDMAYGGTNADMLESLVQTPDGGFLIGGTSFFSRSTGVGRAGSDYRVVKVNASGNVTWDKLLGGSSDDFCNSVSLSHSGGYVVGGWSSSEISFEKTVEGRGEADYWFVELDTTGEIIGQNVLGTELSDDMHVIKAIVNNKYVLGGFTPGSVSGDKTEPSKGNLDFWVLVLSALH